MEKDQSKPMMREVSLETLPNVNIRDPSHDKNFLIISVTGSINQNVLKKYILYINIIFYNYSFRNYFLRR